jgi:20S proteasome subunit beta 3
MKLYSMQEERTMKPETFTHMLSTLLYEKRFGPYFVEPVVAGLDKDGKPYISAMDVIGAPVLTKDFVVAWSSSENIYGMAESLWRPDLGPEDLFETVSQVLLAAVDRDANAGWGAVVYVITSEGTTVRELKARMD